MSLIPSDCRPGDALRVLADPTPRDPQSVARAVDAILPATALAAAKAAIGAWDGYRPTPVHALPGLAAELGIGALYYKQEAGRFGLGSFKALGGAYAVFRALGDRIRTAHGVDPTVADLEGGAYAADTAGIAVTSATDGNHGRAVAWGARRFGCRCVIFVHEKVSEGRKAAIAAYGAEVRVVPGGYMDSVRAAADAADREGWIVISDTSWPGYTETPKRVMAGYMLMAAEAFIDLDPPPTHMFVQAGVGGLPAAVAATAWHRYGPAAPKTIVVEPETAACVLESARSGQAADLPGECHSMMAGLACGSASPIAWQVLEPLASAYLAVPDHAVAPLMKRLAQPTAGDPPLVAGESAIGGLAGLVTAAHAPDLAGSLGLGSDSRVLLFGTEGATDPDLYRAVTGLDPADIAEPEG